MAISKPTKETRYAEQGVALAWGAWVELGVSGWTSTHSQWAIDPEPLILFTAYLGDKDPRLRDEATDWCIRNWRFVSKTRLKNLLRGDPGSVQESYGEFAATVGSHAGITWPGETKPRTFTVTGGSILPPLERPSLAWIRLRAMFGLGARTEILRYFLSRPSIASTVARLANATGYTKRNVAEECESLQRAGVLRVRAEGNRFYYSLARRQALKAFVGELPEILPDWRAVFNITRALVEFEEKKASSSLRTLPVWARQMLKRIEEDAEKVQIPLPSRHVRGLDLVAEVQDLASATLGAWSKGEWPLKDAANEGRQAAVRRLPTRR